MLGLKMSCVSIVLVVVALTGCASEPPSAPQGGQEALEKNTTQAPTTPPAGSSSSAAPTPAPKSSGGTEGKACGGPDHIPCGDGYACDMSDAPKEGEATPMGTCVTDDGSDVSTTEN